jgi:hypothetical protein
MTKRTAKGHFTKNNKEALGGAREGSGRKPDWFKRFCEAELAKDEVAALKLIGKIARGEAKFERAFNYEGRIIKTTIGGSATDVIAATEFLRDSSMGKPVQELEISKKVPPVFDIIIRGVEK